MSAAENPEWAYFKQGQPCSKQEYEDALAAINGDPFKALEFAIYHKVSLKMDDGPQMPVRRKVESE